LFRYRLLWYDGADAGEAEYDVSIEPDDTIRLPDGQEVRVLDLVERAKNSQYDGLLRVERA
jgi:hypothetical protein